ncbi:NAD(P)-dependent oxidoreductase [Pseudoponticoccus marisrubri]|nr:NAD(P)-dependent oxidoreductase [Pseudoponticoccus marisrubri]
MILDQHFRQLEELFRPETFDALSDICRIEGGRNWPMDPARVDDLIEEAAFHVAAFPRLSAAQIGRAGNLRAVMEVAGAINEGLAYDACFDKGIEVLSCAPGFRQSVAEMTLAMALAGGRGLVREHEAFRTGSEHWLDDRPETDFTLFGATVGYIGFGQIARECTRLMAPFAPEVLAFDPFLKDAGPGVALCDLETLVRRSRVVVMAAVPSEETRNLLNAELIAQLPKGALVVVISRAWCVDFPALVAAAEAGHITLATDVFPTEPLRLDDPLRRAPNVILSPHRAAAVPGGRQLIGDMILHDVQAILDGRPDRQMKPANRDQVASLVAAQKGIQS